MAVPLGMVLIWLGYATFYYGFSRIKGGNNTFVQLVYPGKYQYAAPDSGDGGQAAAVSGSQQQGPNATNAPGILPNAPQSPTPNPTNPSGAA